MSFAFADIERLSAPLAKAIAQQGSTHDEVSAEMLAAALKKLDAYRQREPFGTAHAVGTMLASRLAAAQAVHGAAAATTDATSTVPLAAAVAAATVSEPDVTAQPVVPATPSPALPPPPVNAATQTWAQPVVAPLPPPPAAPLMPPPPPVAPPVASPPAPTPWLQPAPTPTFVAAAPIQITPAPIASLAVTPVMPYEMLPEPVTRAPSSPFRTFLGFLGRVGTYSAQLALPALAGYHAAEALAHAGQSIPVSVVATLTGLTLGFSVCKAQARLAALLVREGAAYPHLLAFVSEIARTALPTVAVTVGVTHVGAPAAAMFAGLTTGIAALFVEASRLDKRERDLGATRA